MYSKNCDVDIIETETESTITSNAYVKVQIVYMKNQMHICECQM